MRLVSVRREFPNEWAAFLAADPATGRVPLALPVRAEHFPRWLNEASTVTVATLMARPSSAAPTGDAFVYPKATANPDPNATPQAKAALKANSALGGLWSCDLLATGLVSGTAFDAVSLTLDSQHFDELWLAIAVAM
jgi:hypothetical protein